MFSLWALAYHLSVLPVKIMTCHRLFPGTQMDIKTVFIIADLGLHLDVQFLTYLSNIQRTHTIYLMYLPILIQWMRKEKDQNVLRRFILPGLALCGSVFMVIASVFSHGMGCVWYLIVFAVIMTVGILTRKRKNA